MLERIDETIVAVSSAPGHGALGLVRLSGSDAVEIAGSMSKPGGELTDLRGSTALMGEVEVAPGLYVPARFVVFRSPRSYTRQDMVEIHTIGAPALLALVCKRAIELGAHQAGPGEFTARAFLNGQMDLAGAEAVAGVIRAESDTQLRAARRMMDGSLAKRTTVVREALAELVALVEADIDFSEEPIDFITPTELSTRIGQVRKDLKQLLAGAVCVEDLEGLPRILLIGPPNTGKSSLMNALSGTSRAICAAAAGTTRDVLSAPIRLGRGEAILLDSAGVDETADEIIERARAMTLSTAQHVDLLCVVVDLTDPNDTFINKLQDLEVPAAIVAANKCDLVPESDRGPMVDPLRGWGMGPVCVVSALHGHGLDNLRRMLGERLNTASTTVSGGSIVIGRYQQSAVASAVDSLRRAAELSESAVETIDVADVIAFELREALEALGSVTGEVTTEDLLGRIFERFCIGK